MVYMTISLNMKYDLLLLNTFAKKQTGVLTFLSNSFFSFIFTEVQRQDTGLKGSA